MSKRRIAIYEVLRKTHLQAIGRVAAEWSYLEFATLEAISQVSKIQLAQIIVLTAPSNLAAWLDILMIFVRFAPEHAYKEKRLEKLFEHLKTLQTERNNVVHAIWTPGVKGILMMSSLPAANAKGLGIPKRGRKILVPFEKTPADIRTIATKIARARLRLGALIHQRRRVSGRKLIAQALMAARNPLSNPATPPTPPFSSGVSSTPLLAPQKKKR